MTHRAYSPTVLIVLFAALLGTASADPIARLKERERQVKSVVDRALPAVVAIVGTDRPATGSGVVISKDGLIMTAGHVTEAAGEELTIIFPDGRNVKGESLGANYTRDASLVRITEEGEWPHVEIGSSSEMKLGEWVVAIGHPGGYDINRSPPVRLGRVVSRGVMGMLGSDCTLVGGDSGGPLFNLAGKVVGIHSSIGGSLAENRHVPADVFSKDWDRMLAGETWGSLGMMAAGVDPDRPMMGVQMREEERGVVVRGVMPDSPALRAGLKEGDLILKVDGIRSERMADVVDQVSSRKAGDEIKLVVERAGEEVALSLELVRWEDLAGGAGRRGGGDRPPEEPASGRPQLGVILDGEAGGEGATVYEVIENSAASAAGVLAGDIVLKVDGKTVGDAAGMADLLGGYKPGQELEVELQRGDERKTLSVKLGGD